MKKSLVGILISVIWLVILWPGLAYAADNSQADGVQNLLPQKTIVYTIGEPSYDVDGQTYDMKAAPIIIDGHAVVPILDLASPLGALIKWDAIKSQSIFELDGKTVELQVGNNIGKINGVETVISGNPNLPSHIQLYVPLAVVASNLGCQVSWNEAAQQITLICP